MPAPIIAISTLLSSAFIVALKNASARTELFADIVENAHDVIACENKYINNSMVFIFYGRRRCAQVV